MRHHMIEETFRAIRPKQRGVPAAAPISVGTSGSGDSLSGALSQAAQEIAQLRQTYQAQANLIAANTQAAEKGGAASSGYGGGVISTLENYAGKILGGSLFGLSSLISGISNLFGGGPAVLAPLPTYVPPPRVQLDSTIRNSVTGTSDGAAPLLSANFSATNGNAISSPGSTSSDAGSVSQSRQSSMSYQPQITVQIQALDSQSIMDRSHDIASAVKEAVLNLHPLARVLGDR